MMDDVSMDSASAAPTSSRPDAAFITMGRLRCLQYKTERGFTLIELMVVVAIVAILAAIALPSYTQYIVRGSRQAAQTELLELGTIQEKIFLNSNNYSSSVTGAYTGLATGGLGKTSGVTRDNRYTISVAVDGPTYTLTALPVASSGQAGDGALTLTSQGQRTWGSASW